MHFTVTMLVLALALACLLLFPPQLFL